MQYLNSFTHKKRLIWISLFFIVENNRKITQNNRTVKWFYFFIHKKKNKIKTVSWNFKIVSVFFCLTDMKMVKKKLRDITWLISVEKYKNKFTFIQFYFVTVFGWYLNAALGSYEYQHLWQTKLYLKLQMTYYYEILFFF